MSLESRFRELHLKGELRIPFPGGGQTGERHRKLMEWARADVSLARLAEAHVDALTILHEAKREPRSGLYGVWASQTPGHHLELAATGAGGSLNGSKMFCSGAGIVDRALVTVGEFLVDVDLRRCANSITVDLSGWRASAFSETNTAVVCFAETLVDDIVGESNWYLNRAGFWHGACGPAACWAGGALGLVDYAIDHLREHSHAMAHVGGMYADGWAMQAYLVEAGREIDNNPADQGGAERLALTVRHLIEVSCSDVLRRLGRAFGPRPLAFDPEISKRYQEVELYIRQSHAEQDLEHLAGRLRRF